VLACFRAERFRALFFSGFIPASPVRRRLGGRDLRFGPRLRRRGSERLDGQREDDLQVPGSIQLPWWECFAYRS
jgi:hypothetical protein